MTAGATSWIDADGVRVHAVEWTPTGRVTPERHVLLVHGLGANTISWEPVAQRLADRLEAVVTAVDLIGFGRTRAPDRAATIATNGRLVTALLEARGPAIVIGNSMGGAIGIGVTARRPDLVDALVLVDPAVPHLRASVGAWLRLARLAPVMLPPLGAAFLGTRARIIGPERLVDTSLAWSIHDPARLDPELRDRLVALATERYGYPEAASAYATAARSLFLALPRDVLRDLERAAEARPTLLVHGEHDRLVPLAAARAAAARHPAITFEVLDGVGHAPQLEDPERLVGVIGAWLANVSPSAPGQSVRNARMGRWQAFSSSPSGTSSPS